MKRTILAALAVAAAIQASAGTKKYLAFAWEFRNLKPAQILAHADRFEGLPIDGVGIVVSATNAAGRRYTQIAATDYPAWEWEAFADQVPVLKAIVAKPNLSESFLAGYRAPLHRAAWTDDAAWACIENNMGVIARLAHESGVKGISIDHEDYRQQRQYYHREGDPPYDECRRLARARGRQVFGRVFREHPSAILLSFWILSEYRPYFAANDPVALMRAKGDLWPSFVAGILDALPPTGRFVEGDEHGYRHEHSLNEFHVAHSNVRRIGAKLLPEDIRGKYASRVEQGFGQYLDYFTDNLTPGKRAPWSAGPEGGSRLEHFRRNMQAATEVAEEYVWLWGQHHPWIEWEASARTNAGVDYSGTWEQVLPGVCEMLSTVKGGVAAERRRLDRLVASGATNLIAKVSLNRWQVEKDKRGRPFQKGVFRTLDGGVLSCEGLLNGCYYCYCRNLEPGARYAVKVEAQGGSASASVSWGDGEGIIFRLPSAECVFGEPGPDGWREGLMFLTAPQGSDHLKFSFGAVRQKPGERVLLRNWAVYRLWP